MNKQFFLLLLLPLYASAKLVPIPPMSPNSIMKSYIDENKSTDEYVVIYEESPTENNEVKVVYNCENGTIMIPEISFFDDEKNLIQTKKYPENNIVVGKNSYGEHVLKHICQWKMKSHNCKNNLQVEAAYTILIKKCYRDLGIEGFKPHLTKPDFININKYDNCHLNIKLSQNKLRVIAIKLKQKFPEEKKYCDDNLEIFKRIEKEVKSANQQIKLEQEQKKIESPKE